MAVVMPISSPRMLRSGPPELPGLMAASVWMKSLKVRSSLRSERPSALTTPVVTVCESPNGLPMATTVSPINRSRAVPSAMEGSRASALMRSTARSVSASAPTSWASNSRPSTSVTRIRLPRWITCEFVRIVPSASTIVPEPRLVCSERRGRASKKSRKNSSKNGSVAPGKGVRSITCVVEMLTTAGLARSTASTTIVRRIGSTAPVAAAAPRRQARRTADRSDIARSVVDDGEQLSRLDGLARFHANLLHGAGPLRGDLVLHLHGFDHEETLTLLDRHADLDEDGHDLAGHDGANLLVAGSDGGAAAPARALVEELEPVRLAVGQDGPRVALGGHMHLVMPVIEHEGVGSRGGGARVDRARLAVDRDVVPARLAGHHHDRPRRFAHDRLEGVRAALLSHAVPPGAPR